MANIKNFGIKGIASDVQLGKGGGFVVYNGTAGRFEFKDSGSALENVQFGTVEAGTWQGTAVGVAYGGTGLTSVAQDKILYTTGTDTFGTASVTATGISLLGSADAAAGRTTLGLDTMATQADTAVDINGGAIDGTIIGAAAAAAGSFTTINASSTITGNLTGNVIGDVTGNADSATALAAGQTIGMTGDVTWTSATFDGTSGVTGTSTLATVYSGTASVGSSIAVPVLTIDAKGRITGATTAALSTALTIDDGASGTQQVDLGADDLQFLGTTNEIETAVTKVGTDVKLTIGLPSDVTIGNDLTVTNDLTVSGTFTSDDITSATVSVSGDAIITGNLTVQGTTTTIESTTVTTADAIIQANQAGANTNAGFEANTASGVKSIIYTAVGTEWDFGAEDVKTTGDFKGDLIGGVTGDVIGDVTGTVTGTVSSIANHDTDALSEGSTNLYYTDARSQAALTVTDAGGDGSLGYLGGTLTYTGPSAAEARAHFSGGTGVSITSGSVAIGQDVATTANVSFDTVTADLVGGVTGDVIGNVTGNADTATALAAGVTIATTGDVAYTSASFDGSGNVTGAATLATVNSDVGQFGTTTAIPVVTVNAKGLVTAVTTASIATAVTIQGDSGGAQTVDNGDAITIAGGTNITSVSGATDTVTLNLDTALTGMASGNFSGTVEAGTLTDGTLSSTAGTVTGGVSITSTDFVGDLTGDVTGDVTGSIAGATANMTGLVTGGSLTDGTATLASGSLTGAANVTASGTVSGVDLTASGVLTGATLALSSDAVIGGNLTVNGTTTTISSVNTTVTDTVFELNSGASTSTGDIGLVLQRGGTGDNAFMGWDESADKFILGTTLATGSSTGDLTIADAGLQIGDVISSGTVQFGSLSDGTVTLTAFTTEGTGIGATDNDTTVPTSAAVKDYVDTAVTAVDDTVLRATVGASAASAALGTMPNTAGRTYIGSKLTIKVTTPYSGGSVDGIVVNDGTNDLMVAAQNDPTISGMYVVDLGAEVIAGGAAVTVAFVQADGSTSSTPTAGALVATLEYQFMS